MASRHLPGSGVAASGLLYPESIRLATVGQELLDRGCAVELASVGAGGEIDVRLLVDRTGSAVAVELLGPCDGVIRPDRWHAVRVDADGSRCVWAGPARSCPPEALVAFVEDLLGEELRPLAGRHGAVG